MKDMIEMPGATLDPFEVAAFMPEEKPFRPGSWRMVFLMKSGQIVKSDWLIEIQFRSWKTVLQVLFKYIHPGEIEEWKVQNGFTGYLDGLDFESKPKAMKEAERKFKKTNNPFKK